jgi:N-sulfoglucosamine sulfohydrolase
MRCLVLIAIVLTATSARAADRPNILWISAEDISAVTCGCYGGPARTPRIDSLATDGLRFDAAFSAAPVCAPSRSAIITGIMPTTLGSLPMRCRATPPPFVVGFPKLLREAGYYCTNNAKTDYNLVPKFEAGWNDSGTKAHWRNRPDPAQPFFAVYNLGVTHESGLFADRLPKVLASLPAGRRADPAAIEVPPFYPDTPVIREAVAHRLDLAAALDRDTGKILDQLAADGLADSTIVVFWGDHGEAVPRGKRALTDYGLRVPLLVRVPERFRSVFRLPGGGEPSGTTGNLVNLLDLGPTALDLAGIEIPAWIEGKSFLGPHATVQQTVIGVADRMDDSPGFGRSVRDERFRYVRNFLPWLDGDDLPDYASGVPITGELRRVRAAGRLPPGAAWFSRSSRPAEELYEITADPHEVDDLAGQAAHAADQARLRESLRAWMRQTRDTGILPEPILRREARGVGNEWAIFHPAAGGQAADQAAATRYDAILAAAWDVADQPPEAPWQERLAAADPAVRFWAVHGIGWQAARAEATAAPLLEPVLADSDPLVRVTAAWWLLKLAGGESPPALDTLGAALREADREIRQQVLVGIDQLGDAARPLWKAALALELTPGEEYSRRTLARLRSRLAEPAAAPRRSVTP